MGLLSWMKNWVEQASTFLKNVWSQTLKLWATIAASSALVGLFTNPLTAVWSLASMGLYNVWIPTMALGWLARLTGKVWGIINGTEKNLVNNLR